MGTRKNRTNDPMRLMRRTYVVKLKAEVDEAVALEVEHLLKLSDKEYPSAHAYLVAKLQESVDEEIYRLREAGRERVSEQERAKNEAKAERLRAELEAVEQQLGLHQDPPAAPPAHGHPKNEDDFEVGPDDEDPF